MTSATPAGGVTAADGTGRPLLAACLGAASGVAAGNVLAPVWWWIGGLAPLAVLVVWRGLAGRRSPWVWWAGGLLVGLAACAAAPRSPLGEPRMPVRFTATVRDGWRATQLGYRCRVRLERIEARGRELRHHREVSLVVAGRSPADLPGPGSRVEGSGELVFDPAWRLRRPLLRVKTPLLLEAGAGGAAVDHLREAVVRSLQRAADVDPPRIRAAGLAAALVLGRRELLGAGEVTSLRRSGLAHLLAVSGLHVGMVSALAWFALQLAGVRPRSRRWALAGVLAVFAMLAGGAPPVRRAGLGGVLYLGMRQVGRPLLPFPAVAGVITTLLLIEPAALLDVSFQLSAVVTLALVRWAGPLTAFLRWPLGRWAPVVAVAAVAQAASMPLVAIHFGTVPVLGVVTNLVAVPLGFAAVVASLGACLLAGLSPSLGGTALGALAVVQGLLDAVAGVGAHLTTVFPPMGGPLVAALAVVGLAALSWRPKAWVAAIGVVGLAWGWMAWPGPGRGGGYDVRMLPVADGMAVLVSGPGSTVLIDGGRNPTEAATALRALRVDTLAAVVVTHPDVDHTGGIEAVLRGMRVDRLLFPAAEAARRELVGLRRTARERGIVEAGLVKGQRVPLGNLVLDTFWPALEVGGEDNDRSLVTAVTAGGVRVLLTGDLEAPGERALLASGRAPGPAAVLQLGHHGSATSSSPPFLRAVAPTVALVASGLHPRYRYPAAAVVARVRIEGGVLVPQREGVARVSWGETGRLTIETRSPVSVSRRRGARR